MTKLLIKCYLSLIALLGLTVLIWRLNLPPDAALALALLIALAKASVVGWFFMELRKGPALIRIVVTASFLWLAFFFTFGSLDLLWRTPAKESATTESAATKSP